MRLSCPFPTEIANTLRAHTCCKISSAMGWLMDVNITCMDYLKLTILIDFLHHRRNPFFPTVLSIKENCTIELLPLGQEIPSTVLIASDQANFLFYLSI